MPRRRHRLAAVTSVAALVVAGLGLSATRASAEVTGTTITYSSYPSTFTLTTGGKADASASAPGLELDGTYQRSGSSSDGVDTQCYAGDSQTLVGTESEVTGGTFQVTGPAPLGQVCDLRAVPTGTTPTGAALASYPALRQAFDYAGAIPEQAAASAPSTLPSGQPSASPSDSQPAPGTSVNAATPVHLQAGLPQASAAVTLGDAAANGSSPSGGLTTSLLDGSLDASPDVFANAALLPTDGATTSKTQTQSGGIRVDGVNVVTPGAAADLWNTDGSQPGFNGMVSVTSSINTRTGDATVRTSEPLLSCPSSLLPATKLTCTSYKPVGVTLTRTTITSQGGRVTRVTDSFSSAAAHSISLDYEHTVSSTSTGGKDAGPEFSTDGGETYLAGTQGTTVGLPTAPFSVLLKTSGDPTSFAHPAGSVTYSTQPSSAVFANGGDTLVTHYDRSIPAGGAFTLTHSYVSSDSDSEVSNLSQLALTLGLVPAISLSVPASVSTRNVMIGGLVTPGQNGLPLTVLGSTGTTAPVDQTTGAFTLPVVLKPGPQTVAASAVDDMGNTATGTAPVSYDNPLTAGRLDDYLVFGSHVVTAKKQIGNRFVTVRARVRYVSGIRLLVPLHCSSLATSVCTAKIKVSSHGKLLKTVIFTRGPGYRPIVVIPIVASSYGAAGYDGSHHPRPTKHSPHPKSSLWPVGVIVSYTDPDGSSYPGFTSSSVRV